MILNLLQGRERESTFLKFALRFIYYSVSPPPRTNFQGCVPPIHFHREANVRGQTLIGILPAWLVIRAGVANLAHERTCNTVANILSSKREVEKEQVQIV